MSEQGKPGRYTRSANGLAGAMIVIVLAVLAFVAYRGLFRDTPDETPMEVVEYRESVLGLQSNGLTVVYPDELPEGWVATRVDVELGERPEWGLNLLTDDERFVGIRQRDEDVESMLEELVDERYEDADPLTGVGPLADTWEGWTDEGGDHAYTTEVDGQSVVVYGGVSADELAELVEQLTVEPLPGAVSPSAPTGSPTPR